MRLDQIANSVLKAYGEENNYKISIAWSKKYQALGDQMRALVKKQKRGSLSIRSQKGSDPIHLARNSSTLISRWTCCTYRVRWSLTAPQDHKTAEVAPRDLTKKNLF